MKVMVIVKASKDSEAGVMPSRQLLSEMGQYNEELVKAGIMLTGEGLHPTSNSVRVRFTGKDRVPVNGPFPLTQDLIAGFWMWRVNSMEEAVEWVRRCPNPHSEESVIEIRQVFDAEDFAEALTPELREKEAILRAQTLGLGEPRFEDCPERLVAGINESYTFESRLDIPSQWERFAPQIGKVPGQVGSASFGVCWNYKPGCGFDYLAGVEVKEANRIPGEYAQVHLAAGRYAVFSHREHVSAIVKTIETIWTEWVPDAGLKVADAPSFERYTDKFDPATGMGGMEIWLPLEA